MKVTIEIPKSFDGYFSEIDIPKEIKLNNALILYKQGKISISRASELAGLDIYEFMYECKKNDISHYVITDLSIGIGELEAMAYINFFNTNVLFYCSMQIHFPFLFRKFFN